MALSDCQYRLPPAATSLVSGAMPALACGSAVGHLTSAGDNSTNECNLLRPKSERLALPFSPIYALRIKNVAGRSICRLTRASNEVTPDWQRSCLQLRDLAKATRVAAS